MRAKRIDLMCANATAQRIGVSQMNNEILLSCEIPIKIDRFVFTIIFVTYAYAAHPKIDSVILNHFYEVRAPATTQSVISTSFQCEMTDESKI